MAWYFTTSQLVAEQTSARAVCMLWKNCYCRGACDRARCRCSRLTGGSCTERTIGAATHREQSSNLCIRYRASNSNTTLMRTLMYPSPPLVGFHETCWVPRVSRAVNRHDVSHQLVISWTNSWSIPGGAVSPTYWVVTILVGKSF